MNIEYSLPRDRAEPQLKEVFVEPEPNSMAAKAIGFGARFRVRPTFSADGVRRHALRERVHSEEGIRRSYQVRRKWQMLPRRLFSLERYRVWNKRGAKVGFVVSTLIYVRVLASTLKRL